jgi:hypothetical protein
MASVEVKQIEEQPARRLIFSVAFSADAGRVEFPVAILDQGSPAANEAAVLGATIAFADELIASIRRRLAAPPRK